MMETVPFSFAPFVVAAVACVIGVLAVIAETTLMQPGAAASTAGFRGKKEGYLALEERR